MAHNGPNPVRNIQTNAYGETLFVKVEFNGSNFDVQVSLDPKGWDPPEIMTGYWYPDKGLQRSEWAPSFASGMMDKNELLRVISESIVIAYSNGYLGLKEFHDYEWNEVFAFCDSNVNPIPGYTGDTKGFSMFDVAEVFAKDDGERDEANWLAAVKLRDGRFAFVSAGCDYTGFD